MACVASAPAHSPLLEVEVGVGGRGGVSASAQCAELCARLVGCNACALRHDGTFSHGALGVCALFGEAASAHIAEDSGRTAATTAVLLRSDAAKLAVLTRCHAAHVARWRDALASGAAAAELEMLVDASSSLARHCVYAC